MFFISQTKYLCQYTHDTSVFILGCWSIFKISLLIFAWWFNACYQNMIKGSKEAVIEDWVNWSNSEVKWFTFGQHPLSLIQQKHKPIDLLFLLHYDVIQLNNDYNYVMFTYFVCSSFVDASDANQLLNKPYTVNITLMLMFTVSHE